MKVRRAKPWTRMAIPALAFLITLPFSVFLGITLILGHGGYFPYVSVWLDRAAFAVLALAIPLLAATAAHRVVTRRGKADARDRHRSVHAAVNGIFPPEQRDAALKELDRYGTEAHEKEPERVRLAVLDLSKGNLDELVRLVDAAKKDYRDVLMGARNQARNEN